MDFWVQIDLYCCNIQFTDALKADVKKTDYYLS